MICSKLKKKNRAKRMYRPIDIWGFEVFNTFDVANRIYINICKFPDEFGSRSSVSA